MVQNKWIKKYYSSTEVANFLSIPLNQLRYLETKISSLSVPIIKNRKYYTIHDLNTLKSYIVNNPSIKNTNDRIDLLIQNLTDLLQEIKKLIIG